jgi:hypothetical protein
VALADHPQFPNYPNLPSESDISAGLASALSASALLGTHGAVALLLSLFLAVTSCASAELIAVSSILTFDIYKAYFNPSASPERLITVSKYGICVFGLTMSVFAVIWNLAGIDLGWLFLVMGLIIGGAVFPMAFSICWTGQSKAGAIAGPISGLVAGVVAWLVTAQQYFGELTIASTGHEYSTLAGNMAAIFTGLIVTVVVSLCKPQNFDWAITRAINSPPVTDLAVATPPEESQETSLEVKRDGDESPAAVVNSDEKPKAEIHSQQSTPPAPALTAKQEQDIEEANADADMEEHPTKLRRALMVAYIAAISLTLIMDFLVSLDHPSPSLSLYWTISLHPSLPPETRNSSNNPIADPNPNVPLPLRLLARLLHGVDRHLLHLGLRLDVHQLHTPHPRDGRVFEGVCSQSLAGSKGEEGVRSTRHVQNMP